MKNAPLAILILILTTTLSLSPMAFAQGAKTDPGKQEFEANCSVCHGMDAKGNGFLGASLKVVPPDLTVLAKNNGGVFPADRISSVIDGRAEIATHGTRDMPIWGTRYAVNAADHFFDAPYDQEAYIRAHILILVDYLNRVQQK
ncbi:c-type cytochrome [Bradyrhizobium sp.]|uniref:c-type cytochrome n=1 Tax=Bradyrhizobium sp. TaxID=376 RepID=UPI003C74C0D3